MDVFTRTFLSAAADAGIALAALNRHAPVFRRCVGSDESVVLMARCGSPRDCPNDTAAWPAGRMSGDALLLLTHRRMIVTQETLVLHRLRVHLNANLRHVSNVAWSSDGRHPAVEIALTAVDGVRERFLLRLADADQVQRTQDRIEQVFRPRPAVALAA